MKTKRISKLMLALLAVSLMLMNASTVLAADGDLDATFGDPNADNWVYALARQSDGKVLMGGDFTAVGGSTRNHVARLNADGTLDTTFGDPDANSYMNALALQSDGKVLMGGDFTAVGGSTRNRVARLNADGTLDTTFGDPDVNYEVYALALQSDGKVLIGGWFSSVGGSTRYRVARLNADGTLDTTFGDPNVDYEVYALALQSDGKVLIGGQFTTVGGSTRNHVARLNSDGTLDTTFGDPNVNNRVYALVPQSDGRVLMGGDFTAVGGSTRNRVARLNSDGTLDTTFGDPDANNWVYALALQSDGKVLMGGGFTAVGGSTRNRVARLNADGTLDTTFGDPDANSMVYALALQADGKALMGGAFTAVGGSTRNYIARLMGSSPALVYAEPGSGTCGGNAPCYNSLQNAIDAVASGGEVRYYGGSYSESVSLNKSATLNFVGSSDVTIMGNFSISAGTFNAPAAYTLTFQGNFADGGGTFNHNNGTVAFTGSGAQTITSDTIFYKLIIGGSSMLQTSSVVTVNGPTTHSANSVTQETRSIASDAAYNFDLGGVSINIDDRGGLGSIVVRRTESAHPNDNAAGGGVYILDRYYTLTPDANPTQADVCFGYSDAELGVLNENQLRLCRWTGSAWACPARGASSNITTNLVCADDINHFSEWVIGQTGPTAVTLESFTTQVGPNPVWPYVLVLGIAALAGLNLSDHARMVGRKRACGKR